MSILPGLADNTIMKSKKKTFLQAVWDFIGIPFRLVLLDQKLLPRFGWTTLEDERINSVLPCLEGEVLDIGSGPNMLIRRYGKGIGVDVFDWGGGTEVVEDTASLPFDNESFDTVTFIASLNHIPNREGVLREAARVVRPGGKLIVTMINPILGGIGHVIWYYSEDKHRGGMKEGEVGGLWTKDILKMCGSAGFSLIRHSRFVYGLNNIYIFEKNAKTLN